MPAFRSIAANYDVQKQAKYWIASTQYDASFSYGVTGKYGGTLSDFYTQYGKWFQGSTPEPLAIISDAFVFLLIIVDFMKSAAGLLMAYYAAAEYANSQNFTDISKAMKTMPELNLFVGPVKFQPNGTNAYAYIKPFQLGVNSSAWISSSNFTFPAPWSWLPAAIIPGSSMYPFPTRVQVTDIL